MDQKDNTLRPMSNRKFIVHVGNKSSLCSAINYWNEF